MAVYVREWNHSVPQRAGIGQADQIRRPEGVMSLVSAQPVREHVLKLRAAGGTYDSIGRAARTGAMTVHCIANARRPKVQAEVASRLLAVSEADIRGTHPSPGGTMWRLRALVAMGHTCSRMAAAIGMPPATLRRIVRGEAHTISPELRQAVIALFDAWWDKTPPQRTRQEKLAARQRLQRAALNNWPCPAGLDEDELDQPGYQPQCGWRYARGTGLRRIPRGTAPALERHEGDRMSFPTTPPRPTWPSCASPTPGDHGTRHGPPRENKMQMTYHTAASISPACGGAWPDGCGSRSPG